ncbi:hypothetical protein DRO97_08200 [Archaeoglobales archaeon]|nr:MAG: hypothetical protein DRO97_08200 [Archaeoglobales archaeon]
MRKLYIDFRKTYILVENLRKLGKVKHISHSGLIVVSGIKNLPKVGSEVVDRRMGKIGFVYDIIGPTKSPFVLIKPKGRLDKIILDELFVVVSHAGSRKGKGERKRKGKGNRKKRN